jgi:hypothetical protein
MSAEPHAVFIIRIAGRPGQAGVHQLRRLLKDLLRRHKFRALDIREESAAAANDVTVTEETRL